MSIAVCGADSFVRCRWLIIRRKISFTSLRHTVEKSEEATEPRNHEIFIEADSFRQVKRTQTARCC